MPQFRNIVATCHNCLTCHKPVTHGAGGTTAHTTVCCNLQFQLSPFSWVTHLCDRGVIRLVPVDIVTAPASSTEIVKTNLSLVRRKIHRPDEAYTVGNMGCQPRLTIVLWTYSYRFFYIGKIISLFAIKKKLPYTNKYLMCNYWHAFYLTFNVLVLGYIHCLQIGFLSACTNLQVTFLRVREMHPHHV